MTNTFVLMTAMPPTKGHLELIQYAQLLAGSGYTTVIVCTQPDEPFVDERVAALRDSVSDGVTIQRIHRTLPQEPEEDPGFWNMWGDFLRWAGFNPGDYVVASEPYGVRLAEEVGGSFMPYDPSRFTREIRATRVRKNPIQHFSEILPAFQPYLRQTVTVFGAESCGKTTLVQELGTHGWTFPEWARPYLELLGPETTREGMLDIFEGQTALQMHARLNFKDKPFVFQDTDLYSTIGYWEMWQSRFGDMPPYWEAIAGAWKSDLYLILPSTIPFEVDPLRYGGDHREGSDEFWIGIAEKYNLNYIVMKEHGVTHRWAEALRYSRELFDKNAQLSYDRVTKESLTNTTEW